MRDKDPLDLLLDSALSTYADPRAGLEDRVLKALHAEGLYGGSRSLQAPEHGLMEKKAVGPGPSFFRDIRAKYNIRTHRGRLAWTIALPLAACVPLLWLAIPKTIHAPSIPAPHAQHTNSSASSSSLLREPAAKAPLLPSHRTARPPLSSTPPATAQAAIETPPLPKLDVFPTPQPLTTQERALALVATQAPAPLRQALVDAQADDIPPLHIATIHIPPLESPDEGQP